jgi:hypothetical protein
MYLQVISKNVEFNRRYRISHELGEFLYQKTDCFVMRKRKHAGLQTIVLRYSQRKLISTIDVFGKISIQLLKFKTIKQYRYYTCLDKHRDIDGMFRYIVDNRAIRLCKINELYVEWHLSQHGLFDLASLQELDALFYGRFNELDVSNPRNYDKYKIYNES